jgi:phage portal protein BeeE
VSILESALTKARETSLGFENKARNAARQLVARGTPDISALAVSAGEHPFSTPPEINKALRTYQLIKNWVSICLTCITNRVAAQPVMCGKDPRNLEAEEQAAPGAPPPEDEDQDSYDTEGDSARHRLRVKLSKLPAAIRAKAIVSLSKRKRRAKKSHDMADVEVIPDHKLLSFLQRPNHVQYKAEFLAVSIINLYATGVCYWVGGEHEGELEAWAVPTSWVSPVHEGGLFTAYRLKPPDAPGEGVLLDPDMVARVYNAHPADFKQSRSIIEEQLAAIKVDQSIQESQQQMFARGIFPNVAITIGQTIGPDGRPTGRRPVLSGAQRAGLTRAVRQVWRDTVGQGDPAILDGLVESIAKLSHTPQEMDWLQSSDSIKARIFQAFGLHPFMVGAEIPGSYSQAYVTQKIFADNVINPLCDKFSTALTDWLGEPLGLLVWIEPYAPVDETQDNAMWRDARRNGDVSGDEYRQHKLGLPPKDEDENANTIDKPVLASTPAGAQVLLGIATAIQAGQLSEDAGVAQVVYFFECAGHARKGRAATQSVWRDSWHGTAGATRSWPAQSRRERGADSTRRTGPQCAAVR